MEITFIQAGYYYVIVESNASTGGTYTLSAKSHLSPENPDIQYSYDELGRLVGVTYPSGTQIVYTYDGRGNRLGYIVTAACEGDFDADSDVDESDLGLFSPDFGRTNCSGDCEGDLDGDGDVDGSDLAVFAADFGRTNCP